MSGLKLLFFQGGGCKAKILGLLCICHIVYLSHRIPQAQHDICNVWSSDDYTLWKEKSKLKFMFNILLQNLLNITNTIK